MGCCSYKIGIIMLQFTMLINIKLLLIMCVCMEGRVIAGMMEGEINRNSGGRSRIVIHSTEEQNMYRGYGDTIPAAPVQGQANSCSLDLSDELLGGVKAACMQGPLDKKHCCPVLAAWLLAARAKVALHPTLQQQPGMPLLPDDSLVCIASLKAALAARGISLPAPPPVSGNASCDVVTCFCGIHLTELTSQSCPLPFSMIDHNPSNISTANSSTSLSQPTLPHLVEHSSSYDKNNSSYASLPSITSSKDLPFQPSVNDTSINLPSSSSSPPSANNSQNAGFSDLLRQLAANCTDHSYRGCTRCLKTLTKEMRSGAAKGIIRGSKEKAKQCEMIGLMWLLEVNKTLYIPTVSAVVRALLYNTDNSMKCSPDTDNMPLALDYSELLSTSGSSSYPLLLHHPLHYQFLITLQVSLLVFITNFYLLS
eukprot:c23340_g1_i1 orf=71-1342(-)